MGTNADGKRDVEGGKPEVTKGATQAPGAAARGTARGTIPASPKKETEVTRTPILGLITEAQEPSVYEDEALHLEQPVIEQPDTPQEKTAYFNVTSQRKLGKKEAAQTALVFLSLLDGIAAMTLGEKARMLDYEKSLIKEPLERIIQRMDIVSSEIISKWSDPVLLIMGLVAWMSRVLKAEEKPEETIQEKPQPAQPKPVEKMSDVMIQEQTAVPQSIKEGFQGSGITL